MTDTPLIRAARAVAQYTQQRMPPNGDIVTCEGIARAVLEAVREPDDFMVRAGIIERHDSDVPEAWSKATANIYTAMIDAAIDGGLENEA